MDSDSNKSVLDLDGSGKIPTSFWVIAALALLWNLMGLVAFFYDMTISEQAIAALNPGMQELYRTTPIISKIGYGLATICGVIGCILLLIRKRVALIVFVASLLGVVIQNIANFTMTNAWEVIGTSGLPLLLLVIAFAVFLIRYTSKAIDNGWVK